MCRYEDLVTNPVAIVKSIYEFACCRYPSDSILIDVRSDSEGKGKDIGLSPEIDLLCKGLLEKLDKVYEAKHWRGHG